MNSGHMRIKEEPKMGDRILQNCYWDEGEEERGQTNSYHSCFGTEIWLREEKEKNIGQELVHKQILCI